MNIFETYKRFYSKLCAIDEYLPKKQPSADDGESWPFIITEADDLYHDPFIYIEIKIFPAHIANKLHDYIDAVEIECSIRHFAKSSVFIISKELFNDFLILNE